MRKLSSVIKSDLLDCSRQSFHTLYRTVHANKVSLRQVMKRPSAAPTTLHGKISNSPKLSSRLNLIYEINLQRCHTCSLFCSKSIIKAYFAG